MTASSIVAVVAEEGDLVGNWSWTVWLLIPLAVLVAVVTALSVGPRGEPPRSRHTTRGVSRYLIDRASRESGGQEQ